MAAVPADSFPVDTTRFHPTFLYESLWSMIVLISLLVLERRRRRWLRPGDLFLFYSILYVIGAFSWKGCELIASVPTALADRARVRSVSRR